MATKLYGHIVSTCTQRVLFLLDELKLDYELVPINMMKGEHCVREDILTPSWSLFSDVNLSNLNLLKKDILSPAFRHMRTRT